MVYIADLATSPQSFNVNIKDPTRFTAPPDGPNRGPAHLHTPQRMFSAAAFRP